MEWQRPSVSPCAPTRSSMRPFLRHRRQLDLIGADRRSAVAVLLARQHSLFPGAPVCARLLSPRVMIEAVDRMQGAGLIEHQQTRPSPRARYRSRFRPTEALRARIWELPTAATHFDRRELIVLRGADGQPLPYRETASVYAMRRDVIAHNAFLQDFDVTVVHPEAHYDAQGYLVIDSRRLNPDRTTYYRIFNGRFTRGGRWYGPWWQSVPSRCRAGIRINGEPTCEPDIRGCHMRLLVRARRRQARRRRSLRRPGPPRKDVKLAVNVMLNAPPGQVHALRSSPVSQTTTALRSGPRSTYFEQQSRGAFPPWIPSGTRATGSPCSGSTPTSANACNEGCATAACRSCRCTTVSSSRNRQAISRSARCTKSSIAPATDFAQNLEDHPFEMT